MKKIILLNVFLAVAIISFAQSIGASPADRNIKNATVVSSIHLGTYELYSGIPSMYMGILILQSQGKYKVAFSHDESNFEIGDYSFHPDTNSFEWKTGLFKNNNWGGKVTTEGNKIRIRFNRATYADSK
ncbi:MAG: hypothetical protein WCH78_04690 [Bacteroidota bacterium]